ncbi:hypothetical protein ACLKA6_018098 [Drosophila palustris]
MPLISLLQDLKRGDAAAPSICSSQLLLGSPISSSCPFSSSSPFSSSCPSSFSFFPLIWGLLCLHFLV